MRVKNKNLLAVVFLLLPGVFLWVSLFVGRYELSVKEVLTFIFHNEEWANAQGLGIQYALIWNIRLPRALQALLVGAALAVSGGALQGMFRNPLVDAGMLGVSNGAAFGACLGILISGDSVVIYTLSFIGGLSAVLFSYLISKIYQSAPAVTLVLGGVVVSSVFSALVSFIKYIADPLEKLPTITFWLMGSLSKASFNDMKIAIFPIGIGIVGIMALRWRINVLSIGEKEALTLGVNTTLCRVIVIFCASIATAGAVCISGTIGWIGLIIPHIVRMLIGNDNRVMLPVSLSVGGTFLLLIDILARSLTSAEIPLGVLTAMIGGPFFVAILYKTKGNGSW